MVYRVGIYGESSWKNKTKGIFRIVILLANGTGLLRKE